MLRTVSAHLVDRGRYHNSPCAVQHSGGGGGGYYQHLRVIISAFREVQFCGGISSLPGGVSSAHYNGGKIDHKLQHIDDIITVLMISFCSTDDIIHFSLLLGSILPMEVLLDFQDGDILEFGGFEIDITQDYLRSDTKNTLG